MNRIRKAVPEDAGAFVRIKDQLPMTRTDGTTTTGGFLLGTDEATYRAYIQQTPCLVAEIDGEVVGFGIVFTDTMLRTSDIWQRRAEATWWVDLADYEKRKLCYFEQLAFLPGHKRMVLTLAYHLVKREFEEGAEALFTTTVKEPVTNLAAIPFIKVVNGIHAGNIKEEYPLIGKLNSDIYVVESKQFDVHSKAHPLYSFLEESGKHIQ